MIIHDPSSSTPTNTISTHVLRFQSGGSVTGRFCESPIAWSCVWDVPDKVSKKRRSRMLLAYSNWRNEIFAAYSARTGKRITIFELR